MSGQFSTALSAAKVSAAKPRAKSYKLSDGGGLYLEVTPSGNRYWRYKFRVHGVEGRHAVGVYPATSLAKARELHTAARALVATGQNPNHARKAAAVHAAQQAQREAFGTVGAVCASWRALTDPELKAATARQRERELNNDVLPALGSRSVDSVTRLELVALLGAIQQRAPETARNVRAHLEAIFEHACNTGLLSANPTPPRTILKKRKQTAHAALPTAKLGEFLRAVDAAGMNPETRIALLLVVLCGSRKEEVIGATWDEFAALDAGLWLVPASRMKGKREHLVPLSRQAVALLRELRELVPADRTHLFPNRRDPTRPMANRSLNAVLERLGFSSESTMHGWRSVLSTRYNELEWNPDVVEACLAHVKAGVRGVYNRAQYLEQRRELLQDWADYLDAERAKRRA